MAQVKSYKTFGMIFPKTYHLIQKEACLNQVPACAQ